MNDELQRKLDAMPNAPAKVDLMAKLASELCENDTVQAATLCRQAREIAQAAGYSYGIADCLGILSTCELRLCDYQAALTHAGESQALLMSLGEDGKALRIDNLIGNIQRRLGDYHSAAECFRRVHQSARGCGDRLLEASALNNLGIVYQHIGDTPAALRYYQDGLALYRETGETRFCAVGLVNIAEMMHQSGDLATAGENCRQALDIFNAYGDRHGAASARHLLGRIWRDQGDADRAMDAWHKCLELAQEIGDSETELRALTDMALLLVSLGRTSDAFEHLDLAQVIAVGVRDLPILSSLYGACAELCRRTGDTVVTAEFERKQEGVEQELRNQNV